MAWQLHYTSAEAGPAGRAGFQFVAESPGLPHGVTGKVARHLAYKPPPTAPLAPSAEEIARMPVALSYGPVRESPYDPPGDRHVGDRERPRDLSVVTRCVYLGRDYSGRYGNFLGHAVVATAEELTGLRPVELWRSPLWQDVPASPGTPLPELADLPPGEGIDPDTLGAWLASGGDAAYTRLAGLLENVRRALAGGHGRVILVCADVEEIVRWIAVVSYSLPWPVAARLSFVTYSADPAGAPHIIVGTTPDVWMPADVEAAVVRLDDPAAASSAGATALAGATGAPGRFARTVTDCWRRMDLDGIDAIGELGSPPGVDPFGEPGGNGAAGGRDGDGAAGWGAFEPDTSAALLAFCRGDTSVTAAEQSAIARALSKDLPDWLWDDLARAAGRMDYELAAAVRAHAPEETAELCALRCAVLALADPGLPAPPPASRPGTRAALADDAARALAGARDLDELAHAARTAYAVGAPVDPAGLERAAGALARDGRGDLARLLERLPADLRETVLSGVVAGLEASPDEVHRRMLADSVCDRLWRRDLTHAPRTGTAVILSLVRRGLLSRVEATERLLRLAPHATAAPRNPPSAEISEMSVAEERGGGGSEEADLPDLGTAGWDAGVAEVWKDAPGPAECAALVERIGAALSDSSALSDLPARTFLAAGLDDPEVVRLAGQVRQAVPGYPAKDAEMVLLAAGASEAARPADAAAVLQRLEELARETHEDLPAAARAVAARALAERDPRFRTEVLTLLPDAARRGLARAWLAARGSRDEEFALLEVAVRLHMADAPVPELDSWARTRLGGWSMSGSAESRFKRDPDLAAGLKDLKDATRARRGLPWKREDR
ncbi:hypothetical protein AB0M95_25610 [Sphaerisporangium sp. NPDC051017]|uniref:GAP1-N2 domain-containing protein n=1 Tax=Sphaerisporangium sp. NPDC051017 TaxID=3154636 RepID=UPI00341A4801